MTELRQRWRQLAAYWAVVPLAAVALLCASCEEEALSLRVMTYNVKGLDWMAPDNPRYPVAVSTEDLLQTIRAHDPDVVGLQECWHKSDDQSSLAGELSRATGLSHVFATTTTVGWLPYVQQNVLLSRFPLAVVEELDLGPDPTSQENRRFQYARLELPDGTELHLGNLHLFTAAELQLPALKQIQTFLAERVHDGRLVWTGDFNFAPNADPYSYLTGDFQPALVDPVAARGELPDASAYHTSSAAAPKKRIDYVFVGEGVEVLDYLTVTGPIPNRTYPDHLPVIARVRP
jgi:endonuclease/exonuclease/phosphatase family metal-dependent hydrolase